MVQELQEHLIQEVLLEVELILTILEHMQREMLQLMVVPVVMLLLQEKAVHGLQDMQEEALETQLV